MNIPESNCPQTHCPDWEERILTHLEGDALEDAAEHLRDCPACAAWAAALALDARLLRLPPPEAAAVDYAALRAAAWREALRRTRRRRLLAALAVAAAVLLASRVALHRDPQPAYRASLPGSPAPAARAIPPAPQSAAVPPPALTARVSTPSRTARPVAPPAVRPQARRLQPQAEPDLDRRFAEYLQSVEERQHPATPPASQSPVVLRISTRNPDIQIILLEESKGDGHE